MFKKIIIKAKFHVTITSAEENAENCTRACNLDAHNYILQVAAEQTDRIIFCTTVRTQKQNSRLITSGGRSSEQKKAREKSNSKE
jgi:hypothetical protein